MSYPPIPCGPFWSNIFINAYNLSLLEQISVNISQISNDSATITLLCGSNNADDPLEFVLMSLREERNISLICAIETLIDLEPDMNYTLERRYSDEVSCEVTILSTSTESEFIYT